MKFSMQFVHGYITFVSGMNVGVRLVLVCWYLLAVFCIGCNRVVGNHSHMDSASNNIRIGFWNVENLFDTLNASENDEDFLPEGIKKWNSKKYKSKLSRLASVIYPMHCDILGLAEIENLEVLQDLVQTDTLPAIGYKIVHYDSDDERGIDVAILFNPNKLKKIASNRIKVGLENGDKTRDILYVQFASKINKDTLHVFVNHWPSRREGKEKSEPKRIHVANTLYAYIEQNNLLESNVVIMGDFNDNYYNSSIRNHLRSCKSDNNDSCKFQNITALLQNKKTGTLKFGNHWDIFDQIMLTPKLWQKGTGLYYQRYSVQIFNPIWMQELAGKKYGAPLRTFQGNNWLNGYSDHFPVLANLVYD